MDSCQHCGHGESRSLRPSRDGGLTRIAAALVLVAILFLVAKDQLIRRVPVSLHGDGTSWVVRATLDGGTPARFLLDTGASYCVIAPALASRLSLAPTGSFATIATANGPVRAPIVIVKELDLGGGVCAHDVEAVVHEAAPQLDGLLGLNFLNRYRYAVDPERRQLELEWSWPAIAIDPIRS
jgi:clan AA aspartic protease (TIGR02281 family)